ncbi:hypothetical protein [Cryobacterium soli]|uniref:hypothetical protein n=1 Tax=Cryobacterium soli TaxID=2220095 RepID=UPI0013C3F0E5|nr:hypothetical protein [Cryobacterium soli]
MNPLPPSVTDLEARLGLPPGTLADEDKARAEASLEDATTLALAEVSPAKAYAWEANAPKIVALVVLKAARREYENPRGVNQETQGDHSVGLSETSGVYLTNREIGQIRRAATGQQTSYVGSLVLASAYGDGS